MHLTLLDPDRMYARPFRTAAAWLGLVVCAVLSCSTAQAQTSAERTLAAEPFRIIAPFPPGGPVDSLSRILAAGLTERYKQSAVVENIAGAAGNIGIEKVKRAKPDGHTLLVVPAGNLTINPTLMPNFPFSIERDFVPVTMLAKAPNVLVANPSLNVKNISELIALAKSKPGTLAYASPGVGSGLHLAGELFKQQAGINLLHVPYKGTGPALNDVLGGQVPLMFSNLPGTLAYIKSGKLVALGITELARSATAPDIPTIAEQGVKGVVVTSWYGLLAPAGTPMATAERLARDAEEIFSQPAVREQLKSQGLSETFMKPGDFSVYIKNETAQWASIIKARNIVAQ
jgi:tripartite-type tricarboxylate transporter receptor subunit TctC